LLAKQQQGESDRLVSRYLSGDGFRSRSVGDGILLGCLDVPAPPVRLLADWQREITQRLSLEPGDVEALPLPRARMRWPDYLRCVDAVAHWSRSLGLHDVLAGSEVALMVCRGAAYHNDGDLYGGAAFCNLFLSDAPQLDLHFPALGHRIPLQRGTVVIFDTGQPHGVIDRHSSGFDVADFPPGRDCTQVFLTWELPVEHVGLSQALGIALDVDDPAAASQNEEQLWRGSVPARVCRNIGGWI
jgi:hypothetical protein